MKHLGLERRECDRIVCDELLGNSLTGAVEVALVWQMSIASAQFCLARPVDIGFNVSGEILLVARHCAL